MKAEALDLRDNEEILKECKGDTWRMPGMLTATPRQISGKFYFTNKRIAFRTWGPFKKNAAYDLEYKEIESMSTYSINFIIPTGIKLTMTNGDVYKISVMKRKKYMEIIQQYH